MRVPPLGGQASQCVLPSQDVLGSGASQAEVHAKVMPDTPCGPDVILVLLLWSQIGGDLIESVLNGYNAALMAYGTAAALRALHAADTAA